MKRFLDIVLSSAALFVLAPLFLVIAVAIKLDSRGTVFFRQERMGRGMRPFEVYKFRSMRQEAAGKGPLVTVQGDSRITRVGAFLRRAKLDEFPQLLNVLLGDMSIVGPRPEVPKYVALFRADYEFILKVRPGLTDPASFKYRHEGSLLSVASDPEREYIERILPDKIRLAKAYVAESRLSVDIVLILKTLLEAVGMEATPFVRLFVRYRRPVVVAVHLALVVLSYYFAWSLRFDGRIPEKEMGLFWTFLPWVVAFRGILFARFRLYQGLWRYTGLSDGLNIVSAVALSAMLLVGLVRLVYGEFAHPRSVFIIDGILLIAFMSILRLARRAYHELFAGTKTVRVLVFGAADAGELAIRELNKTETHRVVGLIDDDRQKQGRRIHGVPVIAGRSELVQIASQMLIAEVVMAIDGRHEAVFQEVTEALAPLNIRVTRIRERDWAPELVEPRAAVREVSAGSGPEGVATVSSHPAISAGPCPRCKGPHLLRSHTRGFMERLRKTFSNGRLHRCSNCGWRGWVLPFEFGYSGLEVDRAPLDLSCVDNSLLRVRDNRPGSDRRAR